MAVAVTNLLATGSAVDASSYATASVSLTAGRLYLLTVRNSIGAGTATLPTVTGAGATWTQVITNVFSGNSRRRTTTFRALPTGAGSGALTISFGGTTQEDADWILDEFTGITPGSNGANAVRQAVATDSSSSVTTISVTLSAFGYSGNATYASISTGAAPPPISPEGGYTETGETTASGFGLEAEFLATPDTSPSWTFTSGVVWAAFGFEIQAEPVSPSAENAAGTGAANNAKITIKPTAGNAAGTGTAYDAEVSFLAPPRSFLINGTDYIGKIRLDSFSFTECANRGEVGIGGFDVDDATNSLDIPALKAAVFDEPAAGQSNKRAFTGYTHERATERGPNKVAGQRQWNVEVVDINTLADDFVITEAESGNRASETDYARVTWLLTTAFSTTGGVSAGVVPNSNTVTMDAVDYRGRKARDVLNECSEAAGKNWFVYRYSSGPLLYYDVHTGTSLSSTAKISDVVADVDSSTVWAPVNAPRIRKNPDRIYSKVHLTYNGGTVSVTNATTASTYRTREVHVLDSSISDSTIATAKANKLLTGASSEIAEVSDIAIAVPAANINDIRAGQRVQLKLERHGISAYTYYRCIRRTVSPLNDVSYLITLSFAADVLASANGGRGGDDVWQHKSNANDDGATVIVDEDGITVTDGAITVTNGSAVVIIDGTSDMFRIATSGSTTKTLTTGTSGSNGISLTALGTSLTQPKAYLAYTRISGTSADDAADVTASRWLTPEHGSWLYAATSSGGAVNTSFLAVGDSSAVMFSTLSADPGTQTLTFLCYNRSSGTRYYYAKYYVLDQTAI